MTDNIDIWGKKTEEWGKKFDKKMKKNEKILFKKLYGYSKREPIPAKRKHEVEARVIKKYGRIVCEQCGKKPRNVTLEFHHINMKNSDNRVSNIQLLCPNHHRGKHGKKRRKVYRDMLERKYYSRLIKKKRKKKTKVRKRKRRKKSNPLAISMSKMKLCI